MTGPLTVWRQHGSEAPLRFRLGSFAGITLVWPHASQSLVVFIRRRRCYYVTTYTDRPDCKGGTLKGHR